MRRLILVSAFAFVSACSPASAQSPFPRLLPPSEDFHLTLREDTQTNLPLGPSCTGEAALTLLCHAFSVTLENDSKDTVRLSSYCKEPVLIIWMKQPRSSGGWFPVSRRRDCHGDMNWTNTRLQSGEKTLIQTRLISPSRDAESMFPGSYTLRASLTLWGCIEPADHTDCLSPLQVIIAPSSGAEIDSQEPVQVTSNEISAESPTVPDLGKMKFTFQVEIPAVAPKNVTRKKDCTSENSPSLDCTVFRYAIGNVGDRAVRNVFSTCQGLNVVPEYRVPGGEWTPLPPRRGDCLANVSGFTAILPGASEDGGFTLATLGRGYNTSPLKTLGQYLLRFKFWPSACFASPDGRFCLSEVEQPEPVVSSDLTVNLR